ncbi:DMT family transporter [Vreelandella aquamarina]|jgi:transporter family-2 protein|uniref:DMT family transporter n=1 Tax=Vreelandella aquamarina TaxID=77097 RepID=UPI00384C6E9E|tara:strand:+ start:110 stop:550 length:441 start_codon:yes stop_codon:yes gene_type:complete
MWFHFITVLVAGAMLPMQAGINAGLARGWGHPLWAATVSFGIGTIVLLGASTALRLTVPSWQQLSDIPLWSWSGGILGAFYVTVMVIFAPKLGAATLLALVVAGQMLASTLLDHFGVLGFPQQAISLPRLLGVVLLFLGVILIRRF